MLIYLERLKIVFAANSGMQQDNANNGPYNMQLKNAFLNGMRPEISQFVRKPLIGVGTAGIQAITDHAVHADNVLREKKA